MIIGVKATQIGPGGGLTHLVNCLRWFGELSPDDRFIIYGHSGQRNLFPATPKNVVLQLHRLPSCGLAGRLLWERTRLPKILARDECDILLELGNYGTSNAPCPTVALIHNLAPFVPEYVRTESIYQQMRLGQLKRLTLAAVRHSAGTIYLSEYGRQVIGREAKSSSGLSTVIYHGVEASKAERSEKTGESRPGDQNFILCVSHIYRYKGILELISGYAKARQVESTLPPLVIAGAPYDKAYTTSIRRLMSDLGVEAHVRLVGSVSEPELQRMYRNCELFVFPSKIENCPNILLEAMQAGCAMACSDIGVMPEICADAALYFDPQDVSSLAGRIIELHRDPPLRSSLSKRALRRSADFSWRTTAQQTLDFLRLVRRGGHAESVPTSPGEVMCSRP